MESTKQITKAMEMVASSKLRHAQNRVLNSRPYFQSLSATISDIMHSSNDFSSPYLLHRPVKNTVYVVIAGDRGLAGGYNSNVLKLAQGHFSDHEISVLPIGKKAVDHFHTYGVPMITQQYASAADMSVGDCFSVAKMLCAMFCSGQVDEVVLVYTEFVSVLSQTPKRMLLLPLEKPDGDGACGSDILYEPNCEQVFERIVPEYVGGILYGALCESRASEQAARRTAMDAATQNADEMIADLSLKFNQARQAAITQEITEIVAGS